MATLQQNREARRRKIIENSEKRMKKLLGQDYDGHEDKKPVEITKTEVPVAADNDIPTLLPEVANDTCEIESDATVAHLKHLIASRQNNEDFKSVSQTAVSSSESSENIKTSLKMLDRTRFCSCICLAIIVRWILPLHYGLFYFQSIFLPFAALEIAIFSYQYIHMKEVQLPHSNSMMTGALMLSGIKPEVIATYNKVMGYMTAVTEDCGLFIFSFIVCHIIMS
ncbi:calcium signal-modulating cyclophilin ligand-like [Gigantopelta aegis]|uniref:calcium signal-modulating cyclophilin ligand-like n=1 Tax=Gigantopelta aegis TaxID=1735272 RepID=UPI001B88C63B|nr:calcium signal-modulating cyclophilin ligand-like [Gigantopelta aegis]